MNPQHFIALGIFLTFVLAILAVDLFVLHRKPHAINMKEAFLGTLLPICSALVFTGAIYWAYETHFLGLGILSEAQQAAARYYAANGKEAFILFITGYIIELALSADNVFLFVVLMTFFKVPKELQHRVLFWGVMGALVMRGIMIAAGATLLARFEWIIYIFGVFLLFAAVKMLMIKHGERDPSKSLAIRVLQKILPIKTSYEGKRFFTRGPTGALMGTSLLMVLVCIEFTDLVFALDSIPAIFGITRDWFIIFTSNVFAILGLRSMYFLLAGAMDRFHYLKLGLSAVLGFVGVKMILPAFGYHIAAYISLSVIVSVLVISITLSLLFPRRVVTVGA
ncbi:MAG: TerC family protein [Phycisphaerales bacterium]|nr:TerC family protein [Phycisphaerales bacterium]